MRKQGKTIRGKQWGNVQDFSTTNRGSEMATIYLDRPAQLLIVASVDDRAPLPGELQAKIVAGIVRGVLTEQIITSFPTVVYAQSLTLSMKWLGGLAAGDTARIAVAVIPNTPCEEVAPDDLNEKE